MLRVGIRRRVSKTEDAAGNPDSIAGGIRCKQWDLPNNGGHNSTLGESVVNSEIRTRKSLFPMHADYVLSLPFHVILVTPYFAQLVASLFLI